jgi:hypothetical protein
VSHICALTVFPSTAMLLVANSTPIVDLDSRLNSLRVNRDSTVCTQPQLSKLVYMASQQRKWRMCSRFLYRDAMRGGHHQTQAYPVQDHG